MKKEYIQPAFIAREVKGNTILAGSDFSLESGANTYTKDNFGAKGDYLLFDDEEDDDDDDRL